MSRTAQAYLLSSVRDPAIIYRCCNSQRSVTRIEPDIGRLVRVGEPWHGRVLAAPAAVRAINFRLLFRGIVHIAKSTTRLKCAHSVLGDFCASPAKVNLFYIACRFHDADDVTRRLNMSMKYMPYMLTRARALLQSRSFVDSERGVPGLLDKANT